MRGAFSLIFLLGLMACDGTPAADGELSGRISVTGSSTVAPLVGEIAQRFEAQHPGVRVDVQTGGSSQGIADVRRGTADIGMISRHLLPHEDDLDSHMIARDGIVLIVHAGNPVPVLTRDEIVAIFTGEIRRWSEVGGPDRGITVVNKADGRATLEAFLAHFQLAAQDVRPSIVIGDNQHGIRTVATDPGAIGYVSVGTATFEVSRSTPIRLLPVDGVEPTLRNVGEGTFPLSRPLNLVTRGERTDAVDAFLEHATSAAVHDLVEEQYLVPRAD